MALIPTYNVINLAGISQSVINLLLGLTDEAFRMWGSVLAGDANISVRIELVETTGVGRAEATWGNGTNIGQVNGVNLIIGGPARELQTGQDMLSIDADILIRISRNYLLNEMFLDPTPQTRNDIPSDRTDGLSVMIHEIGHALGFIGYYNTATNQQGDFATAYDLRRLDIAGEDFFRGPNVQALLGGDLELTRDNYSHYGNSNAFPGTNPLTGLMNGVVFYRGYAYTISDLDLAVLADTGLGTIRDDVLDNPLHTHLRGGAGNDRIIGDDVDNVFFGDEGDDNLFGGGGDDFLSGGTGDDVLDGGLGIDTAVFNINFADAQLTLVGPDLFVFSVAFGIDQLISIENLSFLDGVRTFASLFDGTPPTITTFSPMDGALNVAVGSNVFVNFSENIQRGSGTIEIRSGSATGPVAEAFNIASSNRIAISGSVLTIDPTNALAESTTYFVVINSGAIEDLAGNDFTGITSYDFTTAAAADTTPPAVTSFNPIDGASGVTVGANISVGFSETIQRGTGTIEIRSGSASGPLVEAFDAATSARITVSGSQLTIDPTSNLANGTTYFVVFAPGSVRDLAGNSFAGTSSYDFTTAPPANTPPTITSAGGGATAALSIPEGTTAVGTVTATDPTGDPITYSITGGTDAGRFTINPQTGRLSFVAAPDFEQPTDSNGDNVYQVIVTASDGTLSDDQAVTISVANVNEAPTITSGATATVNENQNAAYTAAATDPDAGTVLAYSLSGADAGLFDINSTTGVVTFKTAPNFEAPADAGANNQYNFIVTATDAGGLSDDQAVAITVANVNEAPTVTSGAAATVNENQTAAYTATATDPDAGTVLAYSLSGADAGLFKIDSTTGVVTFKTAPNFEAPADAGANNQYNFIVTATDAGGLSDDQAVAITVANVNEVPVITSNGGGNTASIVVAEGQGAVTMVSAEGPSPGALVFSLSGGADASRFTINPQTGQLSFVAVPDFERPTDSGGDNVYQVIVSASDGSLSDTQTLSVTIEDRSVAPRLIAPDGFAGGIGGTTAVFLTSGFQDIRVIDAPGTITLSGAPGGDDIIRFAGAASAYTITRVGSRVDIADGDTRVSIPVSPTGINVVFADGPRTLGIVNGQVRIGSQLVSNAGAAITAPAETDPLPNLADPAVRGRLIVAEGSPVAVAGKIDVFGTSFDNELFVAAGGDVAIRGGFTGGMDTVGFMGPASDYTAVRSGSTVFIETSGTRVSIPISPTGTKLLFGSEERLLKVDTVTGKTLIGTQEIGASPTPLTTSLQTSSIDAGDVTVSISPNGGDLMALAPDSFEEMLAFAGADSSTGPQRLIDMAESGGLADTQADLQRLLSDVSGFDPLGPADMLRLYYATAYTGMFAQAYLALDDDALLDIHQSGSQFGGLALSPVMSASFDTFAPGG